MRILREPLLHFLVLGTLVYVTATHLNNDSRQYEIDAGRGRSAQLEQTYRQQYGVSPTPSQLQHLLDEYVRNEILYREGLAMGLQQNDEIVRRRVVQKIEFVNEDLEASVEPDATQLATYFQKHRDRYDSEPTVSFEQIFFSADRGGDAAAKSRAERLLASPNHPADGDVFAEGHEFRALTRTGANSLFGDTQLSAALFSSETGGWRGPFKSAYGWHVVRIDDRRPAAHVELESVLARVRSDYFADQRERANQLAFAKIASKYHVVRAESHATTAAESSTTANAADQRTVAGVPRT